jgi:hypothetical protein
MKSLLQAEKQGERYGERYGLRCGMVSGGVRWCQVVSGGVKYFTFVRRWPETPSVRLDPCRFLDFSRRFLKVVFWEMPQSKNTPHRSLPPSVLPKGGWRKRRSKRKQQWDLWSSRLLTRKWYQNVNMALVHFFKPGDYVTVVEKLDGDDMQAHRVYYQKHDPRTYYGYIKAEEKKRFVKFGLEFVQDVRRM